MTDSITPHPHIADAEAMCRSVSTFKEERSIPEMNDGSAIKKKEETENNRQFVKLCEEIVMVNERICDLRPVPAVNGAQALSGLKKIAETVHEELQKEIEHIVGRYYFEKEKGGGVDMTRYHGDTTRAVGPPLNNVEEIVAGLILSNRILGFVNAPALMQRVIAWMQGAKVAVDVHQKKRVILCDALS